MTTGQKISVYTSIITLIGLLISSIWYLSLALNASNTPLVLGDSAVNLISSLRPTKYYDINLILGDIKKYPLPQLDPNDLSELPEFISFQADHILINPTKLTHIGEHQIKIPAFPQNLIFRLQISDKQGLFSNLEQQLKAQLGAYPQPISLYVYDQKRKQGFGINENEIFIPASITKLTYAILVLRDVDKGLLNLDQGLPIQNSSKAYPSDSMYYYPSGKSYPLRLYLEMLIQESDNTAMMHLENLLGGYDNVKNRIKAELGIPNLYRSPSTGKAVDINYLLTQIYIQSYLQPNTNEYLLGIMTNTNPKFHNRIKAGVAGTDGVKVAHKIGNLESTYGLAINDAGIIYGPITDFTLVIMTKDMPNSDLPASIIAETTRTIFNSLNAY